MGYRRKILRLIPKVGDDLITTKIRKASTTKNFGKLI